MPLEVPCPVCGKNLRLGEQDAGSGPFAGLRRGRSRRRRPRCSARYTEADIAGSTPLVELEVGDSDPTLIVLEVILVSRGGPWPGGVPEGPPPKPAPDAAPAPERRRPRLRARAFATGMRIRVPDDRENVPRIHIHPAYGLVGPGGGGDRGHLVPRTLAALGRFQLLGGTAPRRHDRKPQRQAETAASEGRFDDAGREPTAQLDRAGGRPQAPRSRPPRSSRPAARTTAPSHAGLIERTARGGTSRRRRRGCHGRDTRPAR